jgi:hypothetical protein
VISGSCDATIKGSSLNRMTPVARLVATCNSTHEMNQSRDKAIAVIALEGAHRVGADRAVAHPAEVGQDAALLRKAHLVVARAPTARVPLKAEILRGREEQLEEKAAPGD